MYILVTWADKNRVDAAYVSTSDKSFLIAAETDFLNYSFKSEAFQ
jgi:hypothetical protein